MKNSTVTLEDINGDRHVWTGEADSIEQAMRKARFQWPFETVITAVREDVK